MHKKINTKQKMKKNKHISSKKVTKSDFYSTIYYICIKLKE